MLHILLNADPLEHVLPHVLYTHDAAGKAVPFHVGPLILTNQMLMALVAAVLMLLIFPLLFRKPGLAPPKGARNFFESIAEFLRVEVIRPALKEHTDRFVPFLWTLFFFILFCNLLGQVPFAEIFTLAQGKGVTEETASHLGGTATGTMITTGALAVCAFLFIHISGIMQVFKALRSGEYGHHPHHDEHSANGTPNHEAAQDLDHMRGEALAADVPNDFRAVGNPSAHYTDDVHPSHGAHTAAHGHGHPKPAGAAAILAVPLYFWNFAPHPFKPAKGGSAVGWIVDIPVWAMLLVLEVIGAFIKPFALTVRLFANMIAGHIVLGALVLLIPVAAGVGAQIGVGAPVTMLSLLIRVLELFVAFLQAYIFMFLCTLFIASAVAPEH